MVLWRFDSLLLVHRAGVCESLIRHVFFRSSTSVVEDGNSFRQTILFHFPDLSFRIIFFEPALVEGAVPFLAGCGHSLR